MLPVSDVIPPRKAPLVTLGLIFATSVVFAYELQLAAGGIQRFAYAFGVVPSDFRWTRLLTSPFVHDTWIHFGGNVLYLWIFGENVEDAMGRPAFLIFYLAAAAAGALAHAALHPASAVPVVGADAAVAAILGAYFVLYPRSQVLTAVFLISYRDVVEVPAVVFLALWIVLQLGTSLAPGDMEPTGGLAAHLAGFGMGGAVGLFLRTFRRAFDR